MARHSCGHIRGYWLHKTRDHQPSGDRQRGDSRAQRVTTVRPKPDRQRGMVDRMEGLDTSGEDIPPSSAEQRGSRATRLPAGGIRELGLINWIWAKLGARALGVPRMHLFSTIGQHKLLFWLWLPFSSALLRGRLPGVDTELVILRVARLRNCEYERQHHRRIARRRGLDPQQQDLIFDWPNIPDHAKGLTPRQQALLQATDEFVKNRSVSEHSWKQLSGYLDRRQLIEFCLLISQYDGLAATISTLGIALDHPR